jgi:hypothetical protein
LLQEFIRKDSSDELAANRLTIEPLSLLLGAPRLTITLRKQFIQRISPPLSRLRHEASALNRDIGLGAR